MVLLSLLRQSLEGAVGDSSSGLIGVGVGSSDPHPHIPSLPSSGIPEQVPAPGEIIQDEIIHRGLCEISRPACWVLSYDRELVVPHWDVR